MMNKYILALRIVFLTNYILSTPNVSPEPQKQEHRLKKIQHKVSAAGALILFLGFSKIQNKSVAHKDN